MANQKIAPKYPNAVFTTEFEGLRVLERQNCTVRGLEIKQQEKQINTRQQLKSSPIPRENHRLGNTDSESIVNPDSSFFNAKRGFALTQAVSKSGPMIQGQAPPMKVDKWKGKEPSPEYKHCTSSSYNPLAKSKFL